MPMKIAADDAIRSRLGPDLVTTTQLEGMIQS